MQQIIIGQGQSRSIGGVDMNNQVKLIDADKLLYFIDTEDVGNTYENIREAIITAYNSGHFDPDTPPVPTIKPEETHACPKCGKHNCFTTPIEDLNASCFMCSFCNQRSPKDDWR